MRVPTLLAAVPLILLAACDRSAPEPAEPAASVQPTDADLVLGQGFDEGTPVASDIEVQRPQPPGTEAGRVRRAAPTAVSAAAHVHEPAAADPAEAAPIETQADVPDLAGPAADDGAAADATAAGSGKPRIARNEGPIPTPGQRGGVIIIRGGPGGLDDDCAIHPRTPPMSADPPIVTATPDLDRGALINDRSPPGGTLAGNRPLPAAGGELHPSGGRTTMTGRPLPGGRATVSGGRPGFNPRGGIR
jgi:hypothetical protein